MLFYHSLGRWPCIPYRFQDISHISGPMELLNDMNAEGREKLALLKKHIELLEIMARETDTADRQYMLTEAKSHQQQYARYAIIDIPAGFISSFHFNFP